MESPPSSSPTLSFEPSSTQLLIPKETQPVGKKYRMLLFALLILLVLFLSRLLYVTYMVIPIGPPIIPAPPVTPITPPPTIYPTKWRTYTDTVNRYSVKYPPGWTYRERPTVFEGPPRPISNLPQGTVTFNFYNLVGNLENTAIHWGTRCTGSCPETGDETRYKENVDYQLIPPNLEKKALTDGTEYYYVTPSNHDEVFAIIPHPYNSQQFLYASVGFWPDDQGYELFDQFLSTLTFLNQTADAWDPICATENITTIDVDVKSGEATLTHVARHAISIYQLTLQFMAMGIMSDQYPVLSPEEKVYAEDYLQKRLNLKSISAGQTINVNCQLVEEAALKSRLLTIAQRQNLQQYSETLTDPLLKQLMQDIQQSLDDTTLPGDTQPYIIGL